MNQTVSRRTLTTADLPVGTKVLMVRSGNVERESEIVETEVTKVTKTTLTLANRRVFNVSCNARFTADGVITGQRKERGYLSRYDAWSLYLPGDPYLAAMLEGERKRREKHAAEQEFRRVLTAVAYRQNHETVQAALDALNAWVTEHPKEA